MSSRFIGRVLGISTGLLLFAGIFCLRFNEKTMVSGGCPELPGDGIQFWLKTSGFLALGGTLPQILILIVLIIRGASPGLTIPILMILSAFAYFWIVCGLMGMMRSSNDCLNGRQIYVFQGANLLGHIGVIYVGGSFHTRR